MKIKVTPWGLGIGSRQSGGAIFGEHEKDVEPLLARGVCSFSLSLLDFPFEFLLLFGRGE